MEGSARRYSLNDSLRSNKKALSTSIFLQNLPRYFDKLDGSRVVEFLRGYVTDYRLRGIIGK